jgi:HK97 family phage prohead protease
MDNKEFKQHSIELKDLDETKGVVKAFANVYDFKDSDGDISARGSFDRSVSEQFARIRVLKDHNPRVTLGVPLDINTKDSYGLLTTSKFNLEKEVSRDMFSDIKLMHENGLNAELSIGYNVMSRDANNKSIITEYKLMEYSFLSSWGANELSTVQDIKGAKSQKQFIEMIKQAYDLKYSDARLLKIETLLKSIETAEKPLDVSLLINEFKNSIKQ